MVDGLERSNVADTLVNTLKKKETEYNFIPAFNHVPVKHEDKPFVMTDKKDNMFSLCVFASIVTLMFTGGTIVDTISQTIGLSTLTTMSLMVASILMSHLSLIINSDKVLEKCEKIKSKFQNAALNYQDKKQARSEHKDLVSQIEADNAKITQDNEALEFMKETAINDFVKNKIKPHYIAGKSRGQKSSLRVVVS